MWNTVLVVSVALLGLCGRAYAIDTKTAQNGHIEHINEKYEPEAVCYGNVRKFDNTFIQDFLVTGDDVYRVSVYSFEDRSGISVTESKLPGVMSLRDNSETVKCLYYGYSQ